MAFDAYSPSSSDSTNRVEVDFEAMNKYVVETCGLENPEVLVGVLAGIVDLGVQEQEDAEVPFEGSEADEANEIAKNPNTYFKDGFHPETRKPCRLKCWPQKPQQAVALAIDFPDIMLDKGQFFGESKEAPLRIWMGGSFYTQNSGMIIGRPTALKVVNFDKAAAKPKWSFAKNHLLHKMAVAAKLIKTDEVFLPNSIDQLIGKAFQFNVQVFFKENKGKKYFTESVKFVGALGRNQSAPTDEVETFMIQFNQVNKEEDLNQLRNHVINTIKRAENFVGSKLQEQLGKRGEVAEDQSNDQAEAQDDIPAEDERPKGKATPAKPAKTTRPKAVPVPQDNSDDDAPF